ncbi:MAG: 5-methyltetrahydrofolate--homocysteine methyltransferase, partial [Acidobacteriota bacterium]|nr:5-methyltetrahydrofolate--homocysteine methyltransferase [Acidobacteriota bacterium]
ITAKEILDNGLIKGMNSIGKKFKNHEVFLPEVLLAARAMHAAMEVLKPLLIRDGIPSKGKVVLGTVQGDLHDIGKNLVGILLKGAGFDVIDLGNDVAPEQFVETAKREGASVIGMSALLTTTMPAMTKVVELLKKENLQGKIKTIIGGAPVSQAYAEEIGADAYGYDGVKAVECVERLANASGESAAQTPYMGLF